MQYKMQQSPLSVMSFTYLLFQCGRHLCEWSLMMIMKESGRRADHGGDDGNDVHPVTVDDTPMHYSTSTHARKHKAQHMMNEKTFSEID